MRSVNYLIVIFCIFALGGCVGQIISFPIKQNIEDTFIINASLDDTWTAIINTLSDFRLPIKVVEKDSGLIATDLVIFASGWPYTEQRLNIIAHRYEIIAGMWSQARYSLSIVSKAMQGNQTRIKINTYIEAFESNATKSWYVCTSKGVIESNIGYNILCNLGLAAPIPMSSLSDPILFGREESKPKEKPLVPNNDLKLFGAASLAIGAAVWYVFLRED